MIAFVDVNVIPMDSDRVLEKQAVIVEGDRITAVGPVDEVAVPGGVEIIDGKGAYLLPGLADMHMHLVSTGHTFEGPGQLTIYLAEGVTTVRNLSAMPEHITWVKEIVRGEREGPMIYNGRLVVGLIDDLRYAKLIFRAAGTLFPAVLGSIIWLLLWLVLRQTGNQALFQQVQGYLLPSLGALLLIGGLAAGLRVVPFNVYTSKLFPFASVAETPAEARRFVRKIKETGFDFVKPYDYLSPEAYLAVLDEAREQKLYTVGHTLDELSNELGTIFKAGLREVAHVDEFMDAHMIGEASPNKDFNEVKLDYGTIPRTTATVKAYDVIVVSNMVADEVVYQMLEDLQGGLNKPEYAVVHPQVIKTWQTQGRFVSWQGQQEWRRNVQMPFLMALTKALRDAGVPLLVGTDMSVEGMLPTHIHRDLELLVEAGLTPFEALEAGTKNAGIIVRRMGRDGSFGTVEAGQRADLILLGGNPLENISNTRNRVGVMARGRWFTQSELDSMVAEYVASNQTGGLAGGPE